MKEFKEMIADPFRTKKHEWIETIILTPDFLDFILMSLKKTKKIKLKF